MPFPASVVPQATDFTVFVSEVIIPHTEYAA